MIQNDNKPKLAYIFPNLFTAASCFCGVISIISSINAKPLNALLYIFIALIFDGLDGRMARLTHTTSKFGVEFDSLSDLVAFGVAPAVFFYFNIGAGYGKIGTLIAGLFVVFGAIRLARFNITTGTYEPSVFIGLPIPTAAVISAIYTYAYLSYELFWGFESAFLALQLALALLMVSNIRYPSFKKLDLSSPNRLKILVLLILVLSLFYLYKLETLLVLATIYVLYGLLRAIYNLITNKIKMG